MNKKDNGSSVNYIDKTEFRNELIKLGETDIISDELHMMFYTLSHRYSNHWKFRRYTFKEDMAMAGYLRCVRYARSFNTEGFQPFSYYTMVVHRVFLNFIAAESKQQDIKWKALKETEMEYEREYGIRFNLNESIKERVYGKKKSDK
jgi:hypothetical protein